MMRRWTIAALVLLLCSLPAAAATNLLFVFHGRTPLASVFEADTFELLATPSVGLGAFRAFGMADPADPNRWQKFYIVSDQSITVLDSGFAVRGSLFLPAPVAPSFGAAALSADGSRLLVAAGDQIYVIDTSSNSMVATLSPGFSPTAILVLPDSQKAYVVSSGSTMVAVVDLTTNQMSAPAGTIPALPTTLGMPPNGSNIYAATAGSIYDLSVLADSAFAPIPGSLSGAADASQNTDAKFPRGQGANDLLIGRRLYIDKLLVANNGRYYMRADGRLFEGLLGDGSSREMLHPLTSEPLSADALDIATSADGRAVFVAFGESAEILKFDPYRPAEAKQLSLGASPSAIALVTRVDQNAGSLEQVSGNNATIAGGASFTLAVRSRNADGTPRSGDPVFLSNVAPAGAAACAPALTGADGVATLGCTAGETQAPQGVEVSLSAVLGSEGATAPPFALTIVPPSTTDGLGKIAGDLQVVPPENMFQLVVEASENRVPQAGAILTISAEPGDPDVICPRSVTTGQNGRATFNCTTGEADETIDVEVTVSDNQGRSAVFEVIIDPGAVLTDGLSKISGDNQVVPQTSKLAPMVVSDLVAGVPQVNARLRVIALPDDLLMCPIFVFTDENGLGSIECTARAVFFDRLVNVFVKDDLDRALAEPFEITVSRSAGGVATEIRVLSSTPLNARVGQTLVDGLQVRAANSEGFGVAGIPVFFSADPGVTLSSQVAITNGVGVAKVSVTFTCGSDEGRIRMGLREEQVLNAVSFEVEPGEFSMLEKVQGDNQSGNPGEFLNQQALLVKSTDECGNAITNRDLTWSVSPSDAATLRNVLNRTNNLGLASVLVQLGNRGGPIAVKATSGVVSTAFNLTVLLEPTQLLRRSGDGQSIAAGQFAAQPLVVEVQGGNGFGVGAVPVTFAVTQGSATLSSTATTTNALGLAFTRVKAGNTGGAVTVSASAFGQSVSFTLNPGATGPAAPLEGFVNGASFEPGWVPGSTGSIFVSGLLGQISGIVRPDTLPFPTTLNGVQVTVEGIPAPILSLVNLNGLQQINVQVPFGIESPDTATVVIESNGAIVTVSDVPILSAQPGIFEFFLGNTQFAAALHADFKVVTPDNPARPGEVILLFLTGLGPTDPPVDTNVTGPIPPVETEFEVTITLDGADAQNLGSFYAPNLVTAYQVNFRVPADAQSGNLVLQVSADGVSSQQSLLPVAP